MKTLFIAGNEGAGKTPVCINLERLIGKKYRIYHNRVSNPIGHELDFIKIFEGSTKDKRDIRIVLNSAADSHEVIDNYLIDTYVKHSITTFVADYDNIQQEYKESVYNCFENFKLWEKRLYNLGGKIDEIIGLEVPVTCPWYGGTIDCIARINGAVYIIDFKTSKQISAEYLLQVTAYMWIVNNNYAPYLPHIDGVGVIRMDKSKYGVVDDYFLNDFDPNHHNMIVNYQNCFMEYVNAFYRTINAEHIFDKYFLLYLHIHHIFQLEL